MLFLYTYVYVFLCTNNDVYNETSVMLSKTSAHCFIAEEVTTDNGLICGLAMLGKTKYQFYELFTVYSIESLTQLASRVKKGGLIMARLYSVHPLRSSRIISFYFVYASISCICLH